MPLPTLHVVLLSLVLLAPGGPPPCPPCPSGARAVAAAPPPGMVRVPAGPFTRGSPAGVGLEDERPVRVLILSAFDLDVTEVTQAAYAACVTRGACAKPRCTKRDTDWDPVKRGKHPVVCVPWKQAAAYCAFVGKRLPTEAEWEKAARGTDGRRHPWGKQKPTCSLAHYFGCEPRGTLPVGSRPAGKGPYGTLDQAGNVWEWVADWHHADYYLIGPERDPPGPWGGAKKVLRGGAFIYGPSYLDSVGRTFNPPEETFEHVGFRCARDAR